MSRQRLLRIIADVCLRKGGRERIADIDALLDEHGIEGADREALRVEGARLGVYRTLVRTGIAKTIFRALARTRRRVNAHGDDLFDDTLVAFLDEAPPRSPVLRHLVGEFAAFAREYWKTEPRAPAWALDLLAGELALFESDAAPHEPSAPSATPPAELGLDSRIALAASAHLLESAWAVHRLDDESDDAPRAEPSAAVVSRDEHDEVHLTPISPFELAVVRALAGGDGLGDAVKRAGESTQLPIDGARLEALAATLAILAQRGAIRRVG